MRFRQSKGMWRIFRFGVASVFFIFSCGESYLGLGFCNFIGFAVFAFGPFEQNTVHVTHFFVLASLRFF